MCDTFVATGDVTASRNLIFAKNSDREPNEAQAIVRFPRRDCAERELRVTYITIPQVSQTNEVLLSKPFQMWGAEMGANEHGVVIGNEALFTRALRGSRSQRNDGLTGMDMLRLALERTNTAERALECITQLLEQYGQDACGGYTDRKFFYHNSFLIADAGAAFVLETADRQWAARRVRGVYSISNGITLGGEYDFASTDLVEFARRRGWIGRGRDFSFRECYSDRFFTHFSQCRYRQSLSARLVGERRGTLTAADAMVILASHGEQGDETFDAARASMKSLCVHASGLTTPSQTTGSLVAELRGSGPSTYWLTGSAAPCISLFKPFFISRDFPGSTRTLADEIRVPGARADESLWWRAERLHRAVLRDYPAKTALFRAERQALQERWHAEERRLLAAPGGAAASADQLRRLDEFSAACLDEGDRALADWTRRVAEHRSRAFRPLYSLYRRRLDRAAGLA